MVGDSLVFVGFCAVAALTSSLSVAIAAALWLIGLLDADLKTRGARVGDPRPVLRTGAAAVAVAGVTALFTGTVTTGRIGVSALIVRTIAAVGLRLLVRVAPVPAVLGTDEPEPIVVVGDRRSVTETIRRWSRTGNHYQVVAACLTADSGSLVRVGHSGDTIENVPVLGGLLDVPAAVERTGAGLVAVVPGPSIDDRSVRELSWSLESSGAELSVVTPFADVAEHRARAAVVGRQLVVRIRDCVPTGYQAWWKNLADRVLAGLLMVISLPVLACIAVAVRLDSPGPALFRQERVREGGRPFTILKFRTMHVDAEERKAALAPRNIHGKGPLFKVPDDPRVTRLGRILRATSLDELPQLVNVLRGEMSLVGPRPALPGDVAEYDASAHR